MPVDDKDAKPALSKYLTFAMDGKVFAMIDCDRLEYASITNVGFLCGIAGKPELLQLNIPREAAQAAMDHYVAYAAAKPPAAKRIVRDDAGLIKSIEG